MPIINAQEISCRRGQFTLFKPLSFELDDGQSLLISGANGIGKTTLLESIAGLRGFHKGKLYFNDDNLIITKDKWFDNSLYIGHKTGNKKELNCLENIHSFLQIQGISISQDQAESALDCVGLSGYEYQLAGSLSAGQKKRLALARLKLVHFPIWILDEPFVNLDLAGCDWLLSVLDAHLKNKGILIITAHDNKKIKERVSCEIILEAKE